ncbi:MAG: tRNA (adenosine(37)-N6)-threonylcarbamoyltransferase complex ATPase subunit type 1 TsaE [Cytophagales bacterium]|nr:tRNA (adenosine(37)-N6)-threonylcarbamoyltransferase complex ATPase subunit type 1 TsaE [Cytophagales bacterium]
MELSLGESFELSLSDLARAAGALWTSVALIKPSPPRLWLFCGGMGSGKTSWIREIAGHMGVLDPVTSPTFMWMHEYSVPDEGFLYHFDFFRLKKQEEVIQMGMIDYFDSGHYCFIEWPEKIRSLLKGPCLQIELSILREDLRLVKTSIIHGK